jgi:hypothetical protein
MKKTGFHSYTTCILMQWRDLQNMSEDAISRLANNLEQFGYSIEKYLNDNGANVQLNKENDFYFFKTLDGMRSQMAVDEKYKLKAI